MTFIIKIFNSLPLISYKKLDLKRCVLTVGPKAGVLFWASKKNDNKLTIEYNSC